MGRGMSGFGGMVFGVLFTALSAAGTPTVSKYNVCILLVDFSDDPAITPFDEAAFRSQWLQPIIDFFDQQSNGQLTLNVTLVPNVKRVGERRFFTTRLPDDSFGCTAGSGCIPMWSTASSPISQAVAAGEIAATPDGIHPVGGSTADVFDGFLFASALGVDAPLPGVAVPPHKPDAEVGSRTYDMGHTEVDMENDGVYDPLDDWGTAAHELGHMMGPGHPAGYTNAWELMDSCYPCAAGAFMRAERDDVTGSFAASLEGWLPAERFTKFTPPVGGTVVISPIEIDPDDTTAPMAVQVLTGANYSYFLETRRFLGADDFLNELPGNSRIEGVMVLKATPGAVPETVVQIAPPWTDATRWVSTFVPGQVFTDAARDLTISVGASVGNGFPVTVTYGPGATSPIPDVGLVPWLTPPMNSWETIDIWVDSPCNGLERDFPGDPRTLRYRRRGDGTVIGNGDDPCINERNFVYARIRNFGTGPAANVVVHFDVTDPPGVGMRGDAGWAEFARVDSSDFPQLASIAAGGVVEVNAPWTPTASFPAGTFRAPYHTCLRVRCDTLAGELVSSNQDGIAEQENVGWYEMRRPDEAEATPYEPLIESLVLFNGDNSEKAFTIGHEANLPEGWTLRIGDDSFSYNLDPVEQMKIPVTMLAPTDTPIGRSFFVQATAHAMESAFAPDGTFLEINRA